MHSASVVVMVHGPALATTVFMARHAALVHIVPSTVYPMQQHLQAMVCVCVAMMWTFDVGRSSHGGVEFMFVMGGCGAVCEPVFII